MTESSNTTLKDISHTSPLSANSVWQRGNEAEEGDEPDTTASNSEQTAQQAADD